MMKIALTTERKPHIGAKQIEKGRKNEAQSPEYSALRKRNLASGKWQERP